MTDITPEAVAKAQDDFLEIIQEMPLLEQIDALSARLADVEARANLAERYLAEKRKHLVASEARITALTAELAAFREAVRFATAPVPPLDLPPQPFGEQP